MYFSTTEIQNVLRFLLLKSLLHLKCNKWDFCLFIRVWLSWSRSGRTRWMMPCTGSWRTMSPFFMIITSMRWALGLLWVLVPHSASSKPAHPSPCLCLEQDEGAGASVFNEGSFFWWEWSWERGPGIKVSISEDLGSCRGIPGSSKNIWWNYLIWWNFCAKYNNINTCNSLCLPRNQLFISSIFSAFSFAGTEQTEAISSP